MDRFFTRSTLQPLVLLALILLTTFSCQGHVIQKRHDIIESGASIDEGTLTNGNETVIIPENEAPVLPEGELDIGHRAKDVINNEENNNVNGVQDSKVTSTTDVNNVIEENFAGHTNHTANNETITNSQTNFTKDFSQDDSVENRLPSKLSDKSTSNTKPLARVSTVSLKEATRVDENKETHSTVPILRVPSLDPSEKPKRVDTTFARSTERAVADVEISTVPVSRSTASILSTIPLTPKISATETIRARISSIPPEVAEKRAKYLSEKLDSSSPSSVNNPEASWSDLKTVGEVHHNNVTLGKSLAQEESIKSVNGKLDSEEVLDKAAVETPSTEKSAEEHETQLQKSNSSRIVDVPDDNSLSSFQSSSNRPTVPVTLRNHPTRPTVLNGGVRKAAIKNEEEKKEEAEVENPKTEIPNRVSTRTKAPIVSTRTSTEKPITNPKSEVEHTQSSTEINSAKQNLKSSAQAPKVVEIPLAVDSERLKNEENQTERVKNEESTEEMTEKVTEKATEKDVYTTTEEEEGTTIDDRTTILDETTTLSHIPKVRPGKTKENLVVETTTTVATTETTEIPTTFYVTTPKEEENKVHHEPTQSVNPKGTPVKTTQSIGSTANTMPTLHTETDSNTPEATKPLTHPTKPITTKSTSTETNQRIIVPASESESTRSSSTTTSATEKAAEKSVPLTVSTVDQEDYTSESSLPGTPRIVSFASTSVPVLRKEPEHQTEVAQGEVRDQPDVNAMIAIGISIVAVVTLILLVGFLVIMRKRQKQLTYGQRCRPIGLDAYSLDNISVYNSVRRKSAIRTSKRAFGNAGFDDPGLKNNPLNISQLATFSQKRVSINEEFKDVPTVTARIEEVPIGCEDKNRYANVVPLPESRVHLKRQEDDEKTEYINANFVKGPKDTTHYYIACQAPLEQTIIDFWRMIWEQNSRVIIMATDLTENGIEKCAEYLPSSFVIDNHVTFGDYQITLKNREVRDKYAVSTVHLKNACTKTWREITHFWYQWPENGVPTDEASVIAMLLEARSYLKMVTPEQSDENGQAESDLDGKMSNGNLDKTKSLQRVQGPLTVHCSPGTGRTGTIIACDIAIRSLEQPTRTVDVPQIVYFVRRGRASAVQTREQYEFIYKVAHVYATKLTGQGNDN